MWALRKSGTAFNAYGVDTARENVSGGLNHQIPANVQGVIATNGTNRLA
jgi:hypothetical protein